MRATRKGRRFPSARAAGFSPADTGIGSKLLQRAHVKAEILRQLAKHEITAERVLAELSHLAFSDMGDYAAWSPDGVMLKPNDEISDLARRAVAEVSETATKDGGSLKFKLHDKLGALTTEEEVGGQHVHFHLHTNVDFPEPAWPGGERPSLARRAENNGDNRVAR